MDDLGADLKALPTVPPGFEVKVFAREPIVRQPCSMAFDAKGRLFIGMGPQYRNPTPNTPGDSVVMLEDTDGDGVADRVTVFATGLNTIQALAWHGRDLWIANSPDLTIVRDLDGDGVADEYVRVYADLGNVEHALHGLNWAPDGKLYMSKGNSKGVNQPDHYAPKPFRELWGLPSPPGAKDLPEAQTFTAANYHHTFQDPRDDWGNMGGILRCDDLGRNLEIVSRGLRNPWDIAFDSGFNWLGTDNDQTGGDRIFMPFFGAHFGWGHAWSAHWTGEGHLPTVPVSGRLFDGSGTGIVYYDAPQFPENFRRVFFVNDWLRKTMFAYRPRWEGALRQPEGGDWQPFVVGGKSLFRPTDLETGPDGALWCLGWSTGYGAVFKDGQLTSEGRVFHIRWTGTPGTKTEPPLQAPKRRKPLAGWTTAELIADFNGPLPVWRCDAQEELVRRGAAVKGDLLAALAGSRLSEAEETWTAWTLGRIAPEDESIESYFTEKLGNEKAGLNLRLQALRILAHRIRNYGQAKTLPAVVDKILANPEPRLRFEAVQAIEQAHQRQDIPALTALLARETDRVTFYATWQALRELAGAETLHAQTAGVAALWLTKHASNPLVMFEPDETTFKKQVKVKLVPGFKPCKLHYTLDGSTPTENSPEAKKSIELKTTTTIKVAMFVKGQQIGGIAETTYRKNGEAPTPVASLLQPPPTPTTIDQALPLVAKGIREQGEKLFFSTGGAGCSNCHRVGKRGTDFGPELTSIGARAEPRHIVESIVDPSAVITEGFNTHLVTTAEGAWAGILLEESGVELTLGLMNGQKLRIQKAKITKHETLPTSAMPVFAPMLTPQQVADLTAWLLEQKADGATANTPHPTSPSTSSRPGGNSQ
jgi:putative membrane-bound dehydrogenase-like protein